MLNPTKNFPAWKREPSLKRMLACAGALHVHGFLPDAERAAVQRRLVKWLDKSAKKGATNGR